MNYFTTNIYKDFIIVETIFETNIHTSVISLQVLYNIFIIIKDIIMIYHIMLHERKKQLKYIDNILSR